MELGLLRSGAYSQGLDLYRSAFLSGNYWYFTDTLEAYLAAIALDNLPDLMKILSDIKQNQESGEMGPKDNFLKNYPIEDLAIMFYSASILNWTLKVKPEIAKKIYNKNRVINVCFRKLAQANPTNPTNAVEFLSCILNEGSDPKFKDIILNYFLDCLKDENPDYQHLKQLSNLLHKRFYPIFFSNKQENIFDAIIKFYLFNKNQTILADNTICIVDPEWRSPEGYPRLIPAPKEIKQLKINSERIPSANDGLDDSELDHPNGFLARWLENPRPDSKLLKNRADINRLSYSWMTYHYRTLLEKDRILLPEQISLIRRLNDEILAALDSNSRNVLNEKITEYAIAMRDIERSFDIQLELRPLLEDEARIHEDIFRSRLLSVQGNKLFRNKPLITVSQMMTFMPGGYRACKHKYTGIMDPEGTVYRYSDPSVTPIFTNDRTELAFYQDVIINQGDVDEKVLQLHAMEFYCVNSRRQEEVLNFYKQTGFAFPCLIKNNYRHREGKLPKSFLEDFRRTDYLNNPSVIRIGVFSYQNRVRDNSSMRLFIFTLLNNYRYHEFTEQEISIFERYISDPAIQDAEWGSIAGNDYMFDNDNYRLLAKLPDNFLSQAAVRILSPLNYYYSERKMIELYNFWRIMRYKSSDQFSNWTLEKLSQEEKRKPKIKDFYSDSDSGSETYLNSDSD